MDGNQIRTTLFEAINDLSRVEYGSLQTESIIQKVREKLQIHGMPNIDVQRAILASLYDLFRIGYLSWGHDLANSRPPFCHVTDLGRKAITNLSRDPANPVGYLASLQQKATLNPITASYLAEALATYNSGNCKACAVMIGVATESVVLEVRDSLVARLAVRGLPKPKGLEDWKIKTVLESMGKLLESKQSMIPKALYERFDSYWSAFTLQIRTIRNDSGHPISIEPVSQDAVHASLLIFPELAMLAHDVTVWIEAEYQ